MSLGPGWVAVEEGAGGGENRSGLRTAATFTPSGGSPTSENYVWDATASVPRLLIDSSSACLYTDSIAPAERVNLATGAVAYLNIDQLGSVRGTISSAGALNGTASCDAESPAGSRCSHQCSIRASPVFRSTVSLAIRFRR